MDIIELINENTVIPAECIHHWQKHNTEKQINIPDKNILKFSNGIADYPVRFVIQEEIELEHEYN